MTSKRWKCPQWLSVRKKPLIKCAVSSVVFMLCYVLLMRWRAGVWMVADSLFLAGLLMLMIGCWYLVRWLGLFDMTAYSWKRLLHFAGRNRRMLEERDPMPDYATYLQQPRKLPSAGEPLLCAAVLMGVYCLVVYIILP